MAQYLDASGVKILWDKVKGHVKTEIEKLDSSIVAAATDATDKKTYALSGVVIKDGKITSGSKVAVASDASIISAFNRLDKIDSSIDAMDASLNVAAGKVVTGIKQENGKVTAISSTDLGNGTLTIKLNDASLATTFSANSTSNVTIDLGKLATDASFAELKGRIDDIDSSIDAMDASLDAPAGKYVSGIKQENGKITAIATTDLPAAYVHPAAAASGSASTAGTAAGIKVGGTVTIPSIKVDASGHVTKDSRDTVYTVKMDGGNVTGSATSFVSKVVLDASGKLDGSVVEADTNVATGSGIPTTAAVKSYVDSKVAGATEYLGLLSSATGMSTTAGKGDFYRAASALADGIHAGDIIIALKDNPSASIDGTNWGVIHAEADTDTTYTFAEGSTDGAFTVTPKGGTAQSVSVHGLAAMAYKAKVADADIDGSISDSHIASASAWNNKLDANHLDSTVNATGNGILVLSAQDNNFAVVKAGDGIKIENSSDGIFIKNTKADYVHPAKAASGNALTAGTAQAPAFGGTIVVNDVKIDASGHVTGDSRKITVTIPATEATTAQKGLMTAAQVAKLAEMDGKVDINGVGVSDAGGVGFYVDHGTATTNAVNFEKAATSPVDLTFAKKGDHTITLSVDATKDSSIPEATLNAILV